MTMPKYGFYSEKQRAAIGYGYYKTVPNGYIITVTMVADSKDPKHSWDDMHFMGEVTDMVENHWSDGNGFVSNHEPPAPQPEPDTASAAYVCPYAYYGILPCTCGHCIYVSAKDTNNNPFGY